MIAAAAAGNGPAPRPAARPVAVSRLTLTAFRSYRAARLETAPAPVVLTGPNGAGKTNLLEALSFLAPGRGLRHAALADIVNREAPGGTGWAVAARLHGAGPAPVVIGTGLEPVAGDAGLRRTVRVDGRPGQQAELARLAAVLWLTPQMDRLFTEGSSQRRRFLDRLVYGFQPDHARHVAALERSLRERTRLLAEPGTWNAAWLDAVEQEAAGHAVAVAAARREMLARLGQAMAAQPSGDPFPQAVLAVAGPLEAALDHAPALTVEDDYRARLAELRRVDAAAGLATEGAHRSDFRVRHGPKDMPAALCSTGEQKALLIGIVLANAQLLAAGRGETPILLLDEVAAHLDPLRREALFERLLGMGAQAWMTGTDAALFAPLHGRAQEFRVENSHITECG